MTRIFAQQIYNNDAMLYINNNMEFHCNITIT